MYLPLERLRALLWLGSGFDRILEIATADGHCHRLMKDSLFKPDRADRLEHFALAKRTAAPSARFAGPTMMDRDLRLASASSVLLSA